MNMTLIGKILVFVNVTLSVAFAAIAVAIFTNRIDWPGSATPVVRGEPAAGEIAKRKAEFQEREKAAALALGRWQSAAQELALLESTEAPKQRAWFAERLTQLEKEPQKPATSLVYGKDGKLQLYAAGQPVPGPAGPLSSRTKLASDLAQTQQEIDRLIQEGEKALREAQDLTIEINGDPQKKQKGIRDLLAEEDLALRNNMNELEYLRPFRYNRQAERNLLMFRKGQLERRIEELKKLALALDQRCYCG
jgi:hypothetical protein